MAKHTLEDLEQLEGYRTLFTDIRFWTPYVKEVCSRHGLACGAVRTGIPGTCPTFIVDERWVVKFFGRLFEGRAAFEAEREAGRLAARNPLIRVARMAATGELGATAWPWPYLIFDYIPGESIGQARSRLHYTDRVSAAQMLGTTLRWIHALPLADSTVFPNHHAPFRCFLEAQRATCVQNQRAWGSLPAHLAAQIDDFMPPLDDLVDDHLPPHLIHADLTADHLLGQEKDGGWTALALIDFGDAMTGSLYYELAALHLDLFQGDRDMLGTFLDAYGLDATYRSSLPRYALTAALLHRFNVFAAVPRILLQTETLDALAQQLWGRHAA